MSKQPCRYRCVVLCSSSYQRQQNLAAEKWQISWNTSNFNDTYDHQFLLSYKVQCSSTLGSTPHKSFPGEEMVFVCTRVQNIHICISHQRGASSHLS